MRTPVAAVAAAGFVLLPTGCAGSAAPTSTPSRHVNDALAFARCMRSHGVPQFPDPDAQGDFPSFQTGVSKQTSTAANGACKHLLSSGGTPGTPEQLREKLAFGVKVAGCLRASGFPNFPDPTRLGSQSLPSGVDLNSPAFRAAETACEHEARKALGLP